MIGAKIKYSEYALTKNRMVRSKGTHLDPAALRGEIIGVSPRRKDVWLVRWLGKKTNTTINKALVEII